MDLEQRLEVARQSQMTYLGLAVSSVIVDFESFFLILGQRYVSNYHRPTMMPWKSIRTKSQSV